MQGNDETKTDIGIEVDTRQADRMSSDSMEGPGGDLKTSMIGIEADERDTSSRQRIPVEAIYVLAVDMDSNA